MPVERMGFCALPPSEEFPFERICHVVERHGYPEGSRKVSEEEAAAINALITANMSQPSQTAAIVTADLKPLVDKINALNKVVAEHAALHDKHIQAIADVKVTTAKAIAQSLEGIGETKG